jgi:hypothetical protein
LNAPSGCYTSLGQRPEAFFFVQSNRFRDPQKQCCRSIRAEAGLVNYHSKVKSKVEVMRGYLGQSALLLEFAGRGFAYAPAANPG